MSAIDPRLCSNMNAWAFKQGNDFTFVCTVNMYLEADDPIFFYPVDICWKLIFVFISVCIIFCQATASTCTSPGKSCL